GSDCGNLLARIPAPASASAPPPGTASRTSDTDARTGAGRPSVLLCAHLDTAPLEAPVDPVLVEGVWENAHEGVLGADNKAAVAVLLALARHICHAGAPV